MTPEDLDRLIHGGSASPLIAALAPLTETERRKLSKYAAMRARELGDGRDAGFIEIATTTGSFSSDHPTFQRMERSAALANLAVMGLCGWGEARRSSRSGRLRFSLAKPDRSVSDVLLARKPDWLERWVEFQLSEEFGDWVVVRKLVREGVCQRPSSDAYIVRMIQSQLDAFDRGSSILEKLRKDPGLIADEIWRIFDVDLGQRNQFPSYVDDGSNERGWSAALIALCMAGDMDRGRLLSAIVGALNRPIHAGNAAWMVSLYERLAPTPAERNERQPKLVDLLHSATPTVVGFALREIKSQAQSGELDGAPFLAAVRPALELRQKGQPLAAVQILRLIAKRWPEHTHAVARAAVPGLAHGSPEVQKSCAELIESLATDPDDALANAIKEQLELTAATVRPRLEAILTRLRPAAGEPGATGRGTPRSAGSPAQDSTCLRSTADLWHPDLPSVQDIPARWCAAAGVDACVAAAREGRPLPPLAFDPMAVPRLDPAARLTPIGSLDELIDRASAAVERLDDADELELLLDGIARLGIAPASDKAAFAARTAPLTKRAIDLYGSDFPRSVESMFRSLVSAWLRGDALSPIEGLGLDATVSIFLRQRMVTLRDQMRRGRSGPLLACPTHRGGWLCPREFIQRLESWRTVWATDDAQESAKSPTGRYDLIQALLRLAPDGRTAARAAATAAKFPGEWGAAVRYALGGEEPIGPTPSIWVAACRARQPHGEIPALAAAHGDLGADGASPASYSWETRQVSDYLGPSMVVIVSVSPPEPPTQSSTKYTMIDRPTVLLNRLARNTWSMDTIGNIRHALSVWPANPEAVIAQGVMAVVDRLDMAASTFSPTANYLEALFDPDAPLTELGRLLLATALMSRDAGTRGLAVDAAIAAAEDDRLQGAELTSIFAKLAATKGLIKVKRLNEALAQVARVSPRHRRAAAEIVQAVLGAIPRPIGADVNPLLASLQEWLVAASDGPAPATRDALATIQSSGKTAQLAKSILTLQPIDTRVDPAIEQSLQARAARALRWTSRGSELAANA